MSPKCMGMEDTSWATSSPGCPSHVSRCLSLSALLPARTALLPEPQLTIHARRWLCKGLVAAAQDAKNQRSQRKRACSVGKGKVAGTHPGAWGSHSIPALTAGSEAGQGPALGLRYLHQYLL